MPQTRHTVARVFLGYEASIIPRDNATAKYVHRYNSLNDAHNSSSFPSNVLLLTECSGKLNMANTTTTTKYANPTRNDPYQMSATVCAKIHKPLNFTLCVATRIANAAQYTNNVHTTPREQVRQ